MDNRLVLRGSIDSGRRDPATKWLDVLKHTSHQRLVNLLLRPPCIVARTGVSIRLDSSSFSDDLQEIVDRIAMGAHKPAFASVALDDPVHDAHESYVPRVANVLWDPIRVFDGSKKGTGL
jgi:hypothetical protein